MNINNLVEVNATADIKTERTIAINVIMHTEYCRKINTLLQDLSLLDSTFVRTVVKWVMVYYKAYNVAPEGNITGIYERERGKLSTTISEDIKDFLQSISDEFVHRGALHNVQFEIDRAEDYLAQQNVKSLIKKLEKSLLTNNTTKAVQEVANFKRVASVDSSSLEITENIESRYKQSKDNKDFLFRCPGVLGSQIGDVKRGHISMVAGASKSGKSRTMLYLVAQAFKAGLNVFVCNLEMTQVETETLIDKAVLMVSDIGGTAHIPVFRPNGKNYNIGLEERKIKAHTPEEIRTLWQEEKTYCSSAQIRVKTWAQETMRTYDDLVPELDILRDTEGFVPDLIVVDYADLMRPANDDVKRDKKYQIMGNRRELKRLAQEMHVHVLTASQAHDDLTVKGDLDKLSDVDWALGIHHSPEEKRLGITHVKTLVHRHVEFNKNMDSTVLCVNGLGLWGLDSKWDWQVSEMQDEVSEDFRLFVPEEVNDYEEEDNWHEML